MHAEEANTVTKELKTHACLMAELSGEYKQACAGPGQVVIVMPSKVTAGSPTRPLRLPAHETHPSLANDTAVLEEEVCEGLEGER